MALTYLNSQMIEVPASVASLSAQILQVDQLTVNENLTEDLNVQGQLLSAGTDLFDIFLTTDSDSQTLTFDENTLELEISNGNTVDLTPINNETLPTVINYLSTSNVSVNDITFSENGTNIFNSAEIFGNIIVHGSLSALSGAQIFESVTSTTSSLSVANFGPGPALLVYQDSSVESVVQIQGSNGADILTVNNTNPDQGQDGVKVNFTGTGNIFVVGNALNSTAFVVTSAGNTNTSGQILSGNIPLHDIFITSETDSQTLTFDENTFDLEISNGNTVSLSALDKDEQTLLFDENTFDLEISNGNTVSLSALALDSDSQTLTFDENTFDLEISNGNTVSLSALDIEVLPTVTNYLSTELVTISSLEITDTTTTTNFTLLSTETVPALSTDPGVKGAFKWDSDYLYICVDTDVWKRVALSGWES